eukprot:41785-Eustigmatos_ZCMA.PRE.1
MKPVTPVQQMQPLHQDQSMSRRQLYTTRHRLVQGSVVHGQRQIAVPGLTHGQEVADEGLNVDRLDDTYSGCRFTRQ